MLKVLINEEEVLTNKDFTIKKEMLNTPSVILNNVYPKSWEDEKDYTSNFYHPQDYSKCKIIDETIIPASDGETITGTSFTIQDYDSTKLVELTKIDGDTTQSGTPTPSSPQPINVVSGRQEVSVVGKNLAEWETTQDTSKYTYSSFTEQNISVEKTATGGSFYASFILHIPTAGTYYLKGNNSSNQQFYIYTDRLWGTLKESFSVSTTGDFKRGTTFNSAGDYVIGFYGSALGNYSVKNFMCTTISDTTYEEYTGQSYEINLGKNLFTLQNISSGTNFGIERNIDNSKITLNGTSTGAGGVIGRTSTKITIPKGTYYFSMANISGVVVPNSKFTAFYLRKPDGTQLAGINVNRFTIENYVYSQQITFNEDTILYVELYCNGENYEFNNITFEIQLEKGNKMTSFAQYKTPIELCKINTYKDMIFRSKGVNLFDKDNPNNESGYLKNDGTVQSTSSFTASDYIDVSNYSRICISGNAGVSELNAFYDEDKNFISTIGMGTLHEYTAAIVPNNAKYLRVTVRNTQLNYYQVNGGTVALPYEPYNSKGKWYLHKEIGKVVLNGSENWQYIQVRGGFTIDNTNDTFSLRNKSVYDGFCNNFMVNKNSTTWVGTNYCGWSATNVFWVQDNGTIATTTQNFKTWLSTHNTIVYYVLATPTTTEITDTELISQLNSIELLEGLNNVSVSSADLPGEITIHYNYNEEQIIDDLLFCGVVKNSGNISLNPRQPHFQSLQILDFKTFLSEGELDSFVIYQKTILEAIQTVIANIQDYGFVLGNVNILNPTDIIGAYSTKDKTAYDVFNYIADITQSRWTTRLIDENHVAIDFYDPTLMVEGTPINYIQAFFEDNLIDDMTYSYGSNNYRNKQVMTSSQVYSNISQQQSIVANGYQTQFPTEQPIGKINSITSNGIPLTFATFNEKEMGYVADFYYQPGENYFESEDLRSTGEILIIDYVAIVEGRQIITNPLEINRISDSTGRKGIISRYEQRNDATTSTELQKIGESYIKYKGTPEIKLKISTRKNIWEVGQRVQFNAPITELDTEYMIRTKKINYISTIDTIFYEYELISSFNSETEINYFDNQRAKASGNIGEGEYISRNIDIESTANIIFYDTETTEVQVSGDNELNSILNSPFIS